MDFLDITDHTGLDTFHGAAQTCLGGTLVTHLGSHFVLSGSLADLAGFIHRVDQRLLHEGVQTSLDRHHGGRSMVVVRSGNGHRVEIFFLLEHDAVIFVVTSIGAFLSQISGAAIVSVTKGDDIFAHQSFRVTSTFTTAANDTNFQFAGSARAHDIGGRHCAQGCQRGCFEEVATAHHTVFIGFFHNIYY